MPRVLRSGKPSEAASEAQADGALFLRADGRPMLFYVEHCDEPKDMRGKIIENGGAVVRIIDDECTPLFEDDALTGKKVKALPRPFYRASYIDDCIQANRLLDLNDYLLPGSSDPRSSSSSSSSTDQPSSSPSPSPPSLSPSLPAAQRQPRRVSVSSPSQPTPKKRTRAEQAKTPTSKPKAAAATPPDQQQSKLKEAPRSASKRAVLPRRTPAKQPTNATDDDNDDGDAVQPSRQLPLSPVAGVVQDIAMRTQLPDPVVYHALIACGGDAERAVRYLEFPYALPAELIGRAVGFAVWTPSEDRALQGDEADAIDRIVARRGTHDVTARLEFLGLA